MSIIWGFYCRRQHTSMKYECEYCDGNCDDSLIEPSENEEDEPKMKLWKPNFKCAEIGNVIKKEVDDEDIPF